MKLDVRYFASLAETTGTPRETIEIDAGSDVGALWELLSVRHAALAGLHYRPLVACDMRYCDWSESLDGVREVAFLPPISGG
ncbi:MAG TPA: MoaD/ThiS family protein [Candidatus Polarisedimenticolaceae bacterium]|nr:MoaD/ThiS family protein [Candidatus Polarisedimenticolaceae bacterium]